MTSLEAGLCQISRELTQARIPFALVGGLAVSVRTEPRFTRDADLAVALASDAAAEALIHNLRTHGYGIEAVVEIKEWQAIMDHLRSLPVKGEGELPVIPVDERAAEARAIELG
jgi:hypothetical protein